MLLFVILGWFYVTNHSANNTIICIVLALFNLIVMSSISIEYCFKIITNYLKLHIRKDMYTKRFTLTEYVFWLQFALVSRTLFCCST